jgi:cytochrome P450
VNHTSTTDRTSPPAGFQPISQDFIGNPLPWLREARKTTPVFFAPDFNFWALTRYEDIERAFTDWETFSNQSLAMVPVPEEFADKVPPGFFATGALISQDPPDHTKRRKMLNKGFSRSNMQKMEEPIEQICNELIDGFIDEGSCDLMVRYCYEVSLRSIVALIGMPTDDLPLLRQLAFDQGAVVSAAIRPMEAEEERECWTRIVDARDYLHRVARERREDPQDDLISMMATATDDAGEPALSPDQIVTHLTEMIFAGTDTTANLMATMVRVFDELPEQLELVKQDPDLWPAAAEETLRLHAGAIGNFRITARDVEVNGITIPAKSVIWAAVSSGNTDPDRFERAETFDLSRTELKSHLGFGKGRHFCMGAPLTRTEAPIGMRVLYERIPQIEVKKDQSFEYHPILAAVVMKHLQVSW